MTVVAEMFRQLGAPEHVGQCFAITGTLLQEELRGEIKNCPVPDYEHAIFQDEATGHHVVIRPGANGDYQFAGLRVR